MAKAPAPQTESTGKPPQSDHLEVQELEEKKYALQMTNSAKTLLQNL